MTEIEKVVNGLLRLIRGEDLTPEELTKYSKLRDRLENNSSFTLHILKTTDYIPEHHKVFIGLVD